ncbi:cytidylyltransferase domain-containing protein [Poseidonibacter lekithochrous]|uniref:acylneuraminate cytidylyltransferase family protein n=1 Tax=Poseidonibacter lekithochrous TaxID=1904463 RepID=UPI0008FC1E87|nr:acylneuraminate cytidylyltransferase family protein [Poseidonibacter lekithochrous]QKJ22269.1 acylneuraminate cytidylyltransferase family protein [Poseidonibacter lekithochrous]
MKFLGIIPARGGSKGIPKKNIKLLKGKPLIAYTIETALNSKLDKVIVSTDCEEIAEVSKNYGVEVMMRTDILAQDKTPTLPVLQDVVSKLDEEYDAIMTLQPTSPLRTENHINESIKLFEINTSADSLVSVVEMPHNFSSEKLMKLEGMYLTGNSNVKRRQEVEIMYARNGAAIYITKCEKLNEYIFGGKILPYFMSKINSFDIDDMEDWEIVEKLIG